MCEMVDGSGKGTELTADHADVADGNRCGDGGMEGGRCSRGRDEVWFVLVSRSIAYVVALDWMRKLGSEETRRVLRWAAIDFSSYKNEKGTHFQVAKTRRITLGQIR